MLQSPLRIAPTIACASLCLFALLVDAANRPIPEVVNIKAFTATQDEHLDLLVRMPLSAVKDVEFPLRDGTHLDLTALKSMLDGASKYRVAGNFEVSNHATVLSRPEVIATRISISSDPSFHSYEDAATHFTLPDIAVDEELSWQQVWLDVHLRYAIGSAPVALAIEPRVAGLGVRVTTELDVVETDGSLRELTFEGNPGRIFLEPRWHDAFGQFIGNGFRAVAGSADFLVFLFCLALPFRKYREAQPATVTFAVAVMLGVFAVSAGIAPRDLWFRSLIDALTAVTLLLIAAANIVNQVTARRRALFALVAGLVFGMFSGYRLDGIVQFAGNYSTLATVTYASGIVLATALAVALFVPLLRLLFAFARAERIERIIISALAADTAWGWLVERWSLFRRIPFQPEFNAGLLATTLAVLAVVVLLGGLLWFINEWLKAHGFADEPAT